MYITKEKSISTSGRALLPYTKELHDKCAFIDKYGEPYNLARKVRRGAKGFGLLVPRNCVPMGKDLRVDGVPVELECLLPPRPNQVDTVAEAWELIQAGESFCLEAPTGSGKTAMALNLIAKYKKKALIIVHKKDLKDQWIESCEKFLGLKKKDIGLIQGTTLKVAGCKVVIAMLQTMATNKHKPSVYRDFGIVVADECESEDTEILTEEGWKYFKDLNKTEKVAQWDQNTGAVNFVYPEKYIDRPYKGKMINLVGRNIDVLCTPNHLQPYRSIRRKAGEVRRFHRKKETKYVCMSSVVELPVAGEGVGTVALTYEMRFKIALQADGSITSHISKKGMCNSQFQFTKKRKIKRFLWLMENTEYTWKEVKPSKLNARRFTVRIPSTYTKLLENICSLEDANEKFVDDFIEELVEWDGSTKGSSLYYSSTEARNVDYVQALCTLGGWKCSRRIQVDNRKDTYKDVHRVWFYKSSYRNTQVYNKNYVDYEGRVYCVRVPKGNIIIRRNNHVTVTGNCHKVSADWFSNAMYLPPAKIRLGLSATCKRSDGKWHVVVAHIGRVRVRNTTTNLTPSVIVKTTGFTLPQVTVQDKKTGRYYQRELPLQAGKTMHVMTMLASRGKRNRLIAHFIKWAMEKDRNIMVMVDTLKHCQNIEEACVEVGADTTKISQYTGGMPKAKLAKAKEQAQVLLCTYKFTTEGTDIPRMDTLVIGTPRSDVIQAVGRILRLFEGKKKPLVLDIVDHKVGLFAAYYNNRKKWYTSIGAKVKE